MFSLINNGEDRRRSGAVVVFIPQGRRLVIGVVGFMDSFSTLCGNKVFRFWEGYGRKAETLKGIAGRAPPGVEPAASFYLTLETWPSPDIGLDWTDRHPFLHSVVGEAWPFSVGGVICLVNSVDERDLSLFHSVQHDSHFISPQQDFVSNALKLEAITRKPYLPGFTCDHVMQYQRRRRCIFRNVHQPPNQLCLSGSAGIN